MEAIVYISRGVGRSSKVCVCVGGHIGSKGGGEQIGSKVEFLFLVQGEKCGGGHMILCPPPPHTHTLLKVCVCGGVMAPVAHPFLRPCYTGPIYSPQVLVFTLFKDIVPIIYIFVNARSRLFPLSFLFSLVSRLYFFGFRLQLVTGATRGERSIKKSSKSCWKPEMHSFKMGAKSVLPTDSKYLPQCMKIKNKRGTQNQHKLVHSDNYWNVLPESQLHPCSKKN